MVNCAGPAAEARPPSRRSAMTVAVISPTASTPATSHGTRLDCGGGEPVGALASSSVARFGCFANWRRITGIRQRHRFTAERISKAVRRAHELGRTGRVAECRSNFGHEVGEVGFGDERAGPQTFLEVRFRDHLRPLEHERRQQFEGLRLEMNFPAGAGQLPALEIERERAEAKSHCGSLDKSCKIPGNPLGHARRVAAILPAQVHASGGLSMRWVPKLVAAIFALTVVHGQAPQPVSTTVQTQSGPVRGSGTDVMAFKGIPYAAPPTGDRRWRPPAAAERWTDVRDATQFGPRCPGTPPARAGALGRAGPASEDCLTLNLWTPAKSSGDRLPVMVWIHGGGFNFGRSPCPASTGRTWLAVVWSS